MRIIRVNVDQIIEGSKKAGIAAIDYVGNHKKELGIYGVGLAGVAGWGIAHGKKERQIGRREGKEISSKLLKDIRTEVALLKARIKEMEDEKKKDEIIEKCIEDIYGYMVYLESLGTKESRYYKKLINEEVKKVEELRA